MVIAIGLPRVNIPKTNITHQTRRIYNALLSDLKKYRLKDKDAQLLARYTMAPPGSNASQQKKVEIFWRLNGLSRGATKKHPELVLGIEKIEDLKSKEITTRVFAGEFKEFTAATIETGIETELIKLAISYGQRIGFKDIIKTAEVEEIAKLLGVSTQQISSLDRAKKLVIDRIEQLGPTEKELAEWGIKPV